MCSSETVHRRLLSARWALGHCTATPPSHIMSDSSTIRLVDLFERATAEELREPDYTLHLEITERMNQRRR